MRILTDEEIVHVWEVEAPQYCYDNNIGEIELAIDECIAIAQAKETCKEIGEWLQSKPLIKPEPHSDIQFEPYIILTHSELLRLKNGEIPE